MHLNWNTPIKITENNSDMVRGKRGIYIWGFQLADGFLPYYVGIAVDVEKRMAEHVSNLLSGKYSIYDKSHLKEFHKHPSKFHPNWPINLPEFLRQRKSLSADIDFMVDHFAFTFAEIEKESFPTIELKDVEKYIIAEIGIARLANSRGGQSNIAHIHHLGPEEITGLFSQ